jgi:uncharacterized membrane protein
MRRALVWTWRSLLVLAFAAYQYLVHASIGSAHAGAHQAVLLWVPLVALAAWVAARASNRPFWFAVLGAAAALIFLAEYQERLGLAAVSGISHAAAYLFLLWYFGRTLTRDGEPLITRLARRVHGSLPQGMEVLTRRLTIAWCVFFAAQLIASALLIALAPIEAWSLFINLLNVPLLTLMFLGQFVYRRVCYADCPRASIWQAIEAFTQDAPLSRRAEVR